MFDSGRFFPIVPLFILPDLNKTCWSASMSFTQRYSAAVHQADSAEITARPPLMAVSTAAMEKAHGWEQSWIHANC